MLRFYPLEATAGERSSGNGGATHREVGSGDGIRNKLRQCAGVGGRHLSVDSTRRGAERAAAWASVQKKMRGRTIAPCLSSEVWWPTWQLEEHRRCHAASYDGTQLPIQSEGKLRVAAKWVPPITLIQFSVYFTSSRWLKEKNT
jgi:hypothetical protein